MKRWLSITVALGAGVLALAIIAAMLALPPAPVRLVPAVSAQLEHSGVSHPVTAVLLNFRGYDTLLEIAVLMLAACIVLAVAPAAEDRADAPAATAVADAVVQTLARVATPLMVLVAVYLLWAGSHQPGGAFQAGAVLAACGVLLNLSRILPAWDSPRAGLRAGLVGGFLVFLTIAAALLAHGSLLEYPPRAAGSLILLIESALTVSIGLTLAGLFLFMSEDRR